MSELVKFADGGEYKFTTHPNFVDAPTWLWSEFKSRTLSAPTRTWQTGSRSKCWTSRPGQMDVHCCHVLFIIFAIFAVCVVVCFASYIYRYGLRCRRYLYRLYTVHKQIETLASHTPLTRGTHEISHRHMIRVAAQRAGRATRGAFRSRGHASQLFNVPEKKRKK